MFGFPNLSKDQGRRSKPRLIETATKAVISIIAVAIVPLVLWAASVTPTIHSPTMTVSGNLTVTGNTTLGDAAGDTLQVNGVATFTDGDNSIFVVTSPTATMYTANFYLDQTRLVARDSGNNSIIILSSLASAITPALEVVGTGTLRMLTIESTPSVAIDLRGVTTDTARYWLRCTNTADYWRSDGLLRVSTTATIGAGTVVISGNGITMNTGDATFSGAGTMYLNVPTVLTGASFQSDSEIVTTDEIRSSDVLAVTTSNGVQCYIDSQGDIGCEDITSSGGLTVSSNILVSGAIRTSGPLSFTDGGGVEYSLPATSGTVAQYLRGDGTWATPAGGSADSDWPGVLDTLGNDGYIWTTASVAIKGREGLALGDSGTTGGRVLHISDSVSSGVLIDEPTTFSRQLLITKQPDGLGYHQASLLINPPTSLANGAVFAIEVGGVDKFMIDEDGDFTAPTGFITYNRSYYYRPYITNADLNLDLLNPAYDFLFRDTTAGASEITTITATGQVNMRGLWTRTIHLIGPTSYDAAACSATVIVCNTDGGEVNITLPPVAISAHGPYGGEYDGRHFWIKNIGAGVVDYDGFGAEQIDGATSRNIAAQWDCDHIIATSGTWHLIGDYD